MKKKFITLTIVILTVCVSALFGACDTVAMQNSINELNAKVEELQAQLDELTVTNAEQSATIDELVKANGIAEQKNKFFDTNSEDLILIAFDGTLSNKLCRITTKAGLETAKQSALGNALYDGFFDDYDIVIVGYCYQGGEDEKSINYTGYRIEENKLIVKIESAWNGYGDAVTYMKKFVFALKKGYDIDYYQTECHNRIGEDAWLGAGVSFGELTVYSK